MSYTESNWKTSYDSKQNGYYRPHVHFNSSSNTVDDQEVKHDSQTLPRKIRTAPDRRTDQFNGNHMFESSHPRSTHSTSSSLQNHHPPPTSSQSFPSELDTVLRHSTNSRLLHGDSDTILTNDFEHQAFHQPNTRKVTKIIPKENYSLSNARPTQPRSASASSAPTIKKESKDPFLTPSDIQRLKNVRRHEPAHVQSGPGAKTSLIKPDSWKTDPVIIKKTPKKKPATETVIKPSKIDDVPKPIVEQPSTQNKKQTEKPKPKRDTSASKPPADRTPAKPQPPEKKKTKEEIEEVKKYMQQKRQEHEEKMLNEKKLKNIQEKERKDKLKKLNEQIKKVAPLPLPSPLLRKLSTSTPMPPKDLTEQTREKLLDLLGPKIINEPPTEHHRNTPFEHPSFRERSFSSSSSSSSSSDSVVEIQPPKVYEEPTIRSRSEPPIQNGMTKDVVPRHHNLLRWAANLTRDCDVIEDKIKYLRPDGTQPFDILPASHQQLQHNDGNLRSQPPVLITNNNKTESEPIIPPKILRPSGRLIKLNKNRSSEYQDQQLPGVGNLRDPLLERRVKRDHAATKIQAAYRGYTVRKSLDWSNQKQPQLRSEFNKRPVQKPKKSALHPSDMLDTPALNLDMRLSDDNFTIGSTLLRNYQRNGINIIPSTPPPVSDQPQRQQKQQQQKIQKPTSLQIYSDDYENMTSTVSSTPVSHKQMPQKPRVIQQPVLNTKSTSSSTSSSSSSSATLSSSSATPTPTPQPHVPSNLQHRRSISPPLPPQMSPDNGRLVHHHPPPPPKTISHRILDERRYSPDALERQLNAELHLLDGVEASMNQVENMERLRSVALAQQEVVSLAQVLKNKPSADAVPERKSSARQVPSVSSTSSSSSHRKPHSSPPTSRPRPIESPSSSSSSSESILTAREKRLRQKFHSETELQAYEKRLKDIEKKIRLLVKRDTDKGEIDYERLELMLKALEIFDEKKNVPSPRPPPPKSSNESSISEDLPASHSTASTVQRKTNNDTSEIHTEPIRRGSESSITSIHQQNNSDIVTTDASDIERRIRNYRDQLKTKKDELEKLKQRKNKDALRRQEDELKKQLQTYNHEIETLRLQPASPKVPVSSRKTPLKSHDSSSSSSSSASTATKPQESSIAEELPASSTTSKSKTPIIEKRIEPVRQPPSKARDFFDDDDEEEEKKKPTNLKPLETPREERDTHHDAQSISTATDLGGLSETDNDDSRRPSMDNGIPPLNLNSLSVISQSKDDSESSSSTATSEKSSKKQVQPERKPSPIANLLPSKSEDDFESSFSTAKSDRSNKQQVQPERKPSPIANLLPSKSEDDFESSISTAISDRSNKQQVQPERKPSPIANLLPSKSEDDVESSISTAISDRSNKQQVQPERKLSPIANLLPSKSEDDFESLFSAAKSDRSNKQQVQPEQQSSPLAHLVPSTAEDDWDSSSSTTPSVTSSKQQVVSERKSSPIANLPSLKSKDDSESSSSTTSSEKSPKQQTLSERKSSSIANLPPSKSKDDSDSSSSTKPSVTTSKQQTISERKSSPIANLPSSKIKDDSESSSSITTSVKSPKQQILSERKSSPIANDYDEDFSEVSHSPATPTKESVPKSKVDDIDVESIQEDLEDKHSLHNTNQSLSSKSSGDEQSEILVLVKKSANNTPRRQDDKTPEQERLPTPPLPPLTPLSQPISETNNDDTSHDVSEDEEAVERVGQENKIDKLTDIFLRTFIDEAIDQGKQIKRLKKETNQQQNLVTQEAQEWMSDDDEDLNDEKPIPQQVNIKSDELTLDLSELDMKNPDERRVESPRKPVIEEPIKPFVPHTFEQVTQLSRDALKILFDQNTDFSNRENIRAKIPNSYFTSNQQDSDSEDIQRNNHAYCQMIFNLCVELLHEMYTENVQPAEYPEWQKSKLISKRFYRGKKPANRHEIEQFIEKKILEILNLNPRQIKYSKWRVSNGRRNGIEKFETVLDDEIRRTESQWVNYDDDCMQLKFDIADLIFDQLIQETLTECFHVINKRLYMSSNSTRF